MKSIYGEFNPDLPSQAFADIVLTRFFGAHVEDVMNEFGDMEKCVCIPIDRNALWQAKDQSWRCNVFVNKKLAADPYGFTHYMRLKASREFVRKTTELGYKMPYIGNIRPARYIINKNNYSARLGEQRVKVDDDDEESGTRNKILHAEG